MDLHTRDEKLVELAAGFARFTKAIAGESASDLTPSHLVGVAAKVVPHARGCALTFARRGHHPRTLAATGELPRLVDAIQFETREGPCLDALLSDEITVVDDLTHETRWPDFVRRSLLETPVRSMLSMRLRLSDDENAAMNFYAVEPEGFADIDVGVASMFAPFVAMSVQSELDHVRAENLEIALESSRQIGTAMGILMARRLITSEQAFELLRRASQHLNIKLRDVAAEVEMTGILPELPEPR